MLKRVNIVGTSGSGKTTFGKNLAAILSIEYIEMDEVFWLKNWVCPSDEEFFQKLETALEKEAWVLDGNYTRTIPIKWKKVDTIIWLDFSFSRTLFQAIKRSTSRAITKKELWSNTGNKESFSRALLSRKSILLWVLQTYKKNRRFYNSAMADKKYSHIKFIRLTSPKECSNFLCNLKNSP